MVTSVREDHEIIDVRSLQKARGAETPAPRTPPLPDPPVYPERAQELFDLMVSKSCDAYTSSCETNPPPKFNLKQAKALKIKKCLICQKARP